MSDIAAFNEQSNADTEREHQAQLDLLSRLCVLLETGAEAAVVKQALDSLIDYSEAHFMSEELLMRMKSYDDFEAHQDDHVHMLEVLREIGAWLAAGQSPLMARKAREVLDFIRQHIASRDKRLADYVRQGH